MASKELVLGGVAAGVLGVILQIAAVATTGWATVESTGAHLGLFKICLADVCEDYPKAPDSLKAVRALVIIGTIGTVVSCGLGLLTYAWVARSKSPVRIFYGGALLTSCVADVFTFLGVGFFRALAYNDLTLDPGRLHYSFFLDLVGGVVGALGGALVFRGGRHDPWSSGSR